MSIGDWLTPAQKGYFEAQHSCSSHAKFGVMGQPKGLASSVYGTLSSSHAAILLGIKDSANKVTKHIHVLWFTIPSARLPGSAMTAQEVALEPKMA
mmetsp:Transcript_2907/g.4357  ORF Transcript_2907/g.4357 Transcript_2907/m.4357 type:complete len:96 (+) Transcript_2907:112-399(+)